MDDGVKAKLRFYRLVVVGLVLLAAVGAYALNRKLSWLSPQAPSVQVFDVAADLAQIARDRAGDTDVSRTYFVSDHASVHLHVMGAEQTCPLHLHRKAEEVTAIVSGTAEVTHVFGQAGRRAEKTARFGPGQLVGSPPYCGHRWKNTDRAGALGNLVFASPPFEGNFYVEPHDERLLQGALPSTADVSDALAAFAAQAEATKQTVLPFFGGRMTLLLTRSEVVLPANPEGSKLVYVMAGRPTLLVDRPHPLVPSALAILSRGVTAKLLILDSPVAVVLLDEDG
jgi:uncharacterized RmlC-like cupin family protein